MPEGSKILNYPISDFVQLLFWLYNVTPEENIINEKNV